MGRKKGLVQTVTLSVRVHPDILDQIKRIEAQGGMKIAKIVESCFLSAITLSYLDKRNQN